jgi:hypothetical protein
MEVGAPDRAREEHVAREEVALGVVGDGRARVTGHGGHLEVDAGDRHELAPVQQVVGLARRRLERAEVVRLAARHPDLDAGRLGDALHRTQVVVVAVRHEHAAGDERTVGEDAEHDVGRVAGIDHGDLGGTLAADEIAVRPVGAQRQLDDVEHGRPESRR